MQPVSENVFALNEMQGLLDHEWELVRAQAARSIAGSVLVVDPAGVAKAPPLDGRATLTHVHASPRGLVGDLRGAPDRVPMPDDSVALVIVRHALEGLPHDSGLERELARVLEPGGTLLLFGLNALSPWRLLWLRPSRRGLRAPNLRSVAHARRTLERLGLEATTPHYLGGTWPRRQLPPARKDGTIGSRWQGAWMLAARKQGGTLLRMTPWPPRRVAIRPAIAQPSTWRACA